MIHARSTKPGKNEICFVRKRMGAYTLCYTLYAIPADTKAGVKYVIETTIDNGIVTESKRCLCPSDSLEKTKEIFTLIVRGSVSPCTLAEILYDYR